MDNKTWLWRKRSAEKTILATPKFYISNNHSDQQEVHKQPIVEALTTKNRAVQNLNDKLAAVLLHAEDNCTHNYAELVTTGQGKEIPEAESVDCTKELEESLMEKVALNEKLAQLDAELKKCKDQLTFLTEEQEQIIHEAVIKASSENTHLRQTLLVKEKLMEDFNKRKHETDAEFVVLMTRLDSTEKENTFLKYEFRVLEKELEIRNDELEYSRRSAEVARKQQFDSIKKITELEAECQRLHATMRKKVPNPNYSIKTKNDVNNLGRDRLDVRRKRTNPSRDLIVGDSTIETKLRFMIEQLNEVEEENRSLKDLIKNQNVELDFSRLMCSRTASRCSPMSRQLSVTSNFENRSDDGISSSGSWALALGLEVEISRGNNKFKQLSEWKGIEVSDMSLMDDFVEMEKLAIVSAEKPLEDEFSQSKAPFDWLQVVLNAIRRQKGISNRSSEELLQDIKISLGLINDGGTSREETNNQLIQFNLNKSICKIIQLIDEIGANSNNVDKFLENKQSDSSHAATEEYFVHVFQWKHSELNTVLQRFVCVCNDLLEGKADMEKFAAELSFSLDWTLNNHTTRKDASHKRDKIKKHFGWNEPKSETDIEVPVKDSTSQKNSFEMCNSEGDLQEENKRLKDKLMNMEVKLELASGKNEALMLELQKSELGFDSLQKELKTLKVSNELIEDQIENQNEINEDLDTQLIVAKAKLNEIFQKFSSLEVELEYKNNCCEELEAACLDLQLQQESVAKIPNCGMNQNGKPSLTPNGWEISEASAKLAECQETILNLGKQLKALASPREAVGFEKVYSTTITGSNMKKLNKRSSLRDQMLAEDGSMVEVLELEEKLFYKDAQNSEAAASNQNSTTRALVKVSSKKQGGVGLLSKLLLRKKKGSAKKGQALIKRGIFLFYVVLLHFAGREDGCIVSCIGVGLDMLENVPITASQITYVSRIAQGNEPYWICDLKVFGELKSHNLRCPFTILTQPNMADSGTPHIALLPSAGMGHLTPFLRLAASLVDRCCHVTLIIIYPTVSNSESQLIDNFLSSYPQVRQEKFHLPPLEPITTDTDPFLIRWQAIRRSANLLYPLLSALSPPLSVLIYDHFLISPMIRVVTELSLPGYVFFASSARMLSFFTSFINSYDRLPDIVKIPGLPPLSVSLIPHVLLNPNHPFGAIFSEDGPNVVKTTGILINSFEKLEPDSLSALNSGKVVAGLPPVHAIGPLLSFEFEKFSESNDGTLEWLNNQPLESVVFVSFGTRVSMSTEQIREIGDGLVKSGCIFLWVVNVKKVDLEAALGYELLQRLNDQGLMAMDWIDQNEVLAHNSVGGFLSHCGWNSVVEAAWHGVRILAWPQVGDQKINAEVVKRVGVGLWKSSWENLVRGQQIADGIKEMMESESLRTRALKLGEEARKAVAENSLNALVNKWKNKNRTL
ncbi:hypothetical protein ACFE04_022311 [Oxalis oulophora]